MSTLVGLMLARLRALPPRARAAVYDVVLAVSALLAAACWVLPLVDVTQVWRFDLDELGQVSIATAAAAALLARLNVPDEEVEHPPDQHRAGM